MKRSPSPRRASATKIRRRYNPLLRRNPNSGQLCQIVSDLFPSNLLCELATQPLSRPFLKHIANKAKDAALRLVAARIVNKFYPRNYNSIARNKKST